MDRTNSAGMWNYAYEYFKAGVIVHESAKTNTDPIYFLIGHSIELCLKAYLRGSGLSIEQLKKLGHNLDKLLEEAKAHGVASLVEISEEFRTIIAYLNSYYCIKPFEYIESGTKTLPRIEDLSKRVGELLATTKDFCMEHRDLHCGKPTAVV
jgi:HEPN domain-containing protein